MKKVFIILILSLILTLTACSASKPNQSQILDKSNGSSTSEEADGGGATDSENASTEHNESIGNTDANNTQNAESSGSSGGKNEDNAEKNDQSGEETNPAPVIGTDVGNLIADVTLTTMDGGTITLSELRGKIVILNIWATWCPPCVSELPEFSRFADDYAEDVVIIAAHTSYKNYNASNYVSNNFADSRIVFAYDTQSDEAYSAAGGDGYVPYTVILDRNGVIVYSNSGPLSYEQLKHYLEQYK